MGLELNTLEMADAALMSGGVLVLSIALVQWRRSGWADPLAAVPHRPNELLAILVWLCMAALLGGGAFGTLAAHRVIPDTLPDEIRNDWTGILSMATAQLLTGLACLTVARLARLELFTRASCSLGRQLLDSMGGWLAALYVCGLVVWYTSWVIELLWPDYQPPSHTVFSTLNAAETPAWIRAVAIGGAAILAPLSEELLFRAILQTSIGKITPTLLGERAGRWAAIFTTAMLFGLLHLGTPQFIPALVCLGILLGYLYERHGTLLVPMTVHALFNIKSLAWYYLAT